LIVCSASQPTLPKRGFLEGMFREKDPPKPEEIKKFSMLAGKTIIVTSHAKTYTKSIRLAAKDCSLPFSHPFVIRSWSMGCRSNGLGHPFREIASRSNGCCYPFEKNLHPFERLRLSVRKNLLPFERLRLSVRKKYSSVSTAKAISSKKNGHPFETNNYPFERLRFSFRKKKMQPFDLLMLTV